MKKFLLPAALAGLVLASCSNEAFTGSLDVSQKKAEIAFSTNVPNLTRGTVGGADAAQKLNNNFVVYGFKYFGTTEPTSSTDVADAAKQQDVFERFNVNYIGNAGTTKTNSKGWEYVGYNNFDNSELQSTKYWDYTADSYVFSAIAGVGVTPNKIESVTAPQTKYDKGWVVTIPAGGSISALYASDRKVVTKTLGADKVYSYPDYVDLTFYSMVTKIRFGIYETVPGYTVHIDKFYCYDGTDWSNNTTTNFGINGTFYGPSTTAATNLTVTYYDNTTAVENRPKVEIPLTSLTPVVYKHFGSNMQATTAIGTTSTEATYDKAGGEYTYILPYQSLKTSLQNELKLYVDFTLTAPNGETIKVKQAKATIPTQYTQWKENFAYTYLFKISDNTNGTTGTPKNPEDPTEPWDPADPRDPEGLYAITFDACVINAEDGLSQAGVQELIASLTTPSINTYAKGIVATANSEYVAGDIYYSAKDSAAAAQFVSTANSAVYEIVYSGTANITEALVADYAKGNGVVLVPVATTAATSVPLSDGTNLTFSANQCKKFTAAAGKNYAIVYTVGGKETFKVVRVAGDNTTTPAYKVTMLGDTVQKITATNNTAKWKLEDGNGVAGANILGAATFFKVEDNNATPNDVTENFIITAVDTSCYQLQLTDSAVAACANGTYYVKYGTAPTNHEFTVNIPYAIEYTTGAEATVVKNGSTDKVTLKVAGVEYAGAKITSVPGITVTDKGAGVYEIAADTASLGMNHVYIAGQDVSVVVISYSLKDASTGAEFKTITYPENAIPSDIDEDLRIQLRKNNGNVDDAVRDGITIVSSNKVLVGDKVTDPDNGKTGIITPNDKKGGYSKFTYENAEFDYYVNYFELKGVADTPDSTKIKRATESTKLTFWCNGEHLNATTSTVKVKKYNATTGEYDIEVTTGFSLTSDGRDLTFGNVTAAGKYQIEYYSNEATPKRLGYEKIEVTD